MFLGSAPFPPSLNFLRDYEGTFISPFREKLLFGKLTGQPKSGQTVELSYSLRTETDIRSFGGRRVSSLPKTFATVSIRCLAAGCCPAVGRSTRPRSRSSDRTGIPSRENITDVGLNYQQVLRIGGRDTTQDFIQTRASLRDDYTRYARWNGTHTLKGGAVLSFLRYEVSKLFNGNPVFDFRQDESFAFPFQARYGVGNPDLSTDNRQFGFFVQDDWAVNSRLTINAGLRWDYESDMLNNDYVTPDFVRTNVAPFVDGSRYFTDGDDRPPFKGAWQPRVGLCTTSPGPADMSCSAALAAITTASSTTRASTRDFASSTPCARFSSHSMARCAMASRRSSGTRPT